MKLIRIPRRFAAEALARRTQVNAVFATHGVAVFGWERDRNNVRVMLDGKPGDMAALKSDLRAVLEPDFEIEDPTP